MFHSRRLSLILVCMAVGGCSEVERNRGEAGREYDLDPQLVFWEHLQDLCGASYAGRLVESVPADEALDGQPLAMHVHECDVAQVRVGFFIGDDRFRDWVVTPTAAGLRLTHRRVHADGTEDDISRYGGETLGPGTARAQDFHADAYPAGLTVEAEALTAEAGGTVWSVEIIPDSVLVYELRREGSDARFRVEFDLSRPLEAPQPD